MVDVMVDSCGGESLETHLCTTIGFQPFLFQDVR